MITSEQTPTYPKVYLYKRIVQAKLFIDANYHLTIDLDNISDEACFSKFHFIRLLKKTYGKTPHQYLTVVRIEKAIQLLQGGQNVSDVCFAIGFDSVSSFSGLFKRIVGQSPSAYLAAYQQTQRQMTIMPLAFVPGCFAFQHGWT